MKKHVILFCISCIFPGSTFAFKLSPMVAQFSPQGEGQTQSFYIENPEDKQVAVQIDIFYRTQGAGGEEIRTETDQFSIYPSQVVLKAQQKRTVRVMWKGPKEVPKELSFRLVAEELPIDLQKQKNTSRTNLNFLLKYVASLYVTPEGARPKVEVRAANQVEAKDGKKLSLILENTGTAHKVMNEISVKVSAGGKTVEVSAESLKVFETENLLAGTKKTFVLPWPKEFKADQGKDSKDIKVTIDFKDSLGKNAN